MGRLFKPNYKLTAQLGSPVYGDWFDVLGGIQDQIVITQMRVQVDVEKSLARQPNRAKIVISNLSQQTRQDIKNAKPLKIRLEVGYDGSLDGMLFVGDVDLADSVHDRTDWLTTIESGDGARAYANSQINQSLGEGVTNMDALKACASAMKMQLPSNAANLISLGKQVAGGGPVAMTGQTADSMSRVLRPLGYQWSIQDEQLQIFGPTDTTADEALVCSQDTGMVGVPNYELPKTPGKPAILKVKMMMTPRAFPGRLLQMQSGDIQGLFRIETVKHRGDNYSNFWHSDIKAKML